jgi:hypothetical protein
MPEPGNDTPSSPPPYAYDEEAEALAAEAREATGPPAAVKLLGAMIVIGFVVFGISMYVSYYRTSADVPPHRGENAVLLRVSGESSFAFTNRESCSEAVRLIARKDVEALEKMHAAGTLLEVPAGTRVRVLRDWYEQRQVRILHGEYEGREVWVQHDWLARPKF